METISQIFGFLTDPANYEGTMGIPTRFYEHFLMSFQSLALGILIALPVGLYIGHKRRFEFLAISVGNLGRALPSFGIVALVYVFAYDLPGTIGFWPTFIALTLLSIPPIMLNTFVGIKEVDRDTIEAAQGMGMTGREVLQRIEIPLAAPLILGGIRTAAVQVVATATLGAFTGWGGLGAFIRDGFAVRDFGQVGAGAVMVALFAMTTELVFAGVQRLVSPRLSSQRTRLKGFRSPNTPEGDLAFEAAGSGR
ncbi:MAG: ABC transporter permease [Actinomycetota bacterium]